MVFGRLWQPRQGEATAAKRNRRMKTSTISPLFLGDFLGQADEPMLEGQRIVVVAFLIRHPEATILFDTGIAPELGPEDESLFRFERRPIDAALASIGVGVDEIDAVVNCHLHADHAGGNSIFRGKPIWVQKSELEAAWQPGFTDVGSADLEEGSLQVISGAAELLPGVDILPTTGHTPGHQSLVVGAASGPTVLLGQAFRTASEFGLALRARERRLAGEDARAYPAWVDDVAELGAARVLLAHDYASWQRLESRH
jgi:glyoxylase-like metal-dependent hydrolase (beta-lactamase superfamily II)